MVLIRTKRNRLTVNAPFGEIINKFQDCNIKNVRTLERKVGRVSTNGPEDLGSIPGHVISNGT